MKKTGKVAIAALIFGLFVVLPVAAQKTKSDFQKMYMDFLKKKGYSASIIEDGSIHFIIDKSGYFIIVNEKEPQMFLISTYLNMENRPKQAALAAANNTNNKIYGTKVCISDDGNFAFFAFGTLLLKPKDFQQIFDKVVAFVDEAVYFFISEFQ